MNIRRLDYVRHVYDRYRFYRRRSQDALAELTGKRLYTVLVDYHSLKKLTRMLNCSTVPTPPAKTLPQMCRGMYTKIL